MAIFIGTSGGDIARVTVTSSSSNTTVAFNKPANIVAGDLMIAKLSCNGALNPNSLTLPSGWTPIADNFNINGGSGCHTSYSWRIAGASEPSSWTATVGANINDDESFIFRVTGHDSITPIDAVAAAFTNSQTLNPTCPSVTTTTNNAVAIFSVSTKGGNVITAEDVGQPVGTTLIQNKRTRNSSAGLNSGLAYLLVSTPSATGTKQWTAYTTTSQFGSTYSFAIREGITYSITSVNGGNPVKSGSTFNSTTLRFTSVTSGDIGGKALTGVSFSSNTVTATFPAYVDSQTYPEPDTTKTLTFSDGVHSAQYAITAASPNGMTSIVLSSPDITDTKKLGYYLALNGHTPVNNDRIVYKTSEVTINPDTGGNAPNAVVTTLWHWVQATSTLYSYDVTITEGGVVTNVSRNFRIAVGYGIGISI